LGCEYIRERKKRGKASRKDLAQQAAAAAANGQKSPNGQSSDERTSPSESRNENGSSTTSMNHDNSEFRRPQASRSLSLNTTNLDKSSARDIMKGRLRAGSLESLTEIPNGHQPHMVSRAEADQIESPASLNLNGYSSMHGYRPAINPHMMNGNGGHPNFSAGQGSLPGYTDMPYAIQTSSPTHYPGNTPGAFRLGDSPLPGFAMGSDATSPGGWMSLPSPSTQYQQHVTSHNFNSTLRYPVLQPLIPHLGNIIPVSLACDLLDLYFASSSSALMHPTSPYVLGYVFRKHSILHPTKPRQCTPALLASMLWVVAQTSDAALLTAPPSSRGRICQKLLQLTVDLLKPLIHGPSSGDTSPNFSNTVINGVALGGLGVAMPGSVNTDGLNVETGAFGAAGTLDDVVTYIHLATVVSASEYKGASLRWWNAAWSLVRELKLGRELPQNAQSMTSHPAENVNDVDADGEADDDLPNTGGLITEEEREERRRIWWLCYTVDRHLALCYNRPLFLLDIECDGLLQPMDDTLWQAGEFYTGDSSIRITSPSGTPRIRRRGPNFECTGHSIFGYFLPLMTILGEIVDLYHAKNHPRFGIGFRSAQEWDDHASEIARQLEAYGQSLKEFELRHLSAPIEEQIDRSHMEGITSTNHLNDIEHNNIGTPSVHSVHTASSAHISEADIQTRIVVAYGTHVMHVLHILLTGKWDPISLLDDNDLWISSQSFINATGHAVSAAEAINHILEYDPGLEFMPFFFGVYLLQGSFLLLLIADKLQVSRFHKPPLFRSLISPGRGLPQRSQSMRDHRPCTRSLCRDPEH
jgi:hypothetical protein